MKIGSLVILGLLVGLNPAHAQTSCGACTGECGNCGTSLCETVSFGEMEKNWVKCDMPCSNGGTLECNYCDCPPQWMGTCCTEPVLCNSPTQIANGEAEGTNYGYGQSVSYVCDKNYDLVGNSEITCEGQGDSWSSPPPSCEFSCPCDNGGTCSVPNNYFTCDCEAGWYGTYCDTKVTCPAPSPVNDGTYEPAPNDNGAYSYGSEVTLHCDQEYEVVGVAQRTCQTQAGTDDVGVWSGSTPSCAYMNSCSSLPCQHNATCVDWPNDFQCLCAPGWSGLTCENDVWPPEVEDCPQDITIYVTQPTVYVSWPPPYFYDNHSVPLEVDTNYPNNGATFPWGVFPVYYTAIKTDNEMSVTCAFNVSVYPTPCGPISAPSHGALACNGWNYEYGAVCAMFCQGDSGPEPDVAIEQMVVCGASGNWSRSLESGCTGNRDLQNYEVSYNSHFYGSACSSAGQLEEIQGAYIGILAASYFSPMCTYWPDGCQTDHVTVTCGSD